MKKPLLAAMSALAVTALVAPAAPAAAVDTIDTGKLRKAVTVSGILGHERALQSIANDNDGTRASGTPGYESSVKYVVKKLRKAGYKVKTQEFTFSFFRELAPATLSQTAPEAKDLEVATLDYSGSGDVSGPLVVAGGTVLPPTPDPSSAAGCAPSDFSTPPGATAVALVQRGTCTFEQKAANAKAAGYAAVVIFNEGQEGRTDLLTGTLGNPTDIPVVGVDFETGSGLADQVSDGPVTVHVTTSTENDAGRPTKNIIADSPKGKSGRTVVVGAHLDSVVAGPGINDNGSGSATILEIAEQMSKLKYTKKGRLQQQVRFAFWGAEEEGLLGSQYYVDHLTEAKRSKIYANLNFDMLGSPNYARLVYDGDGSETGTAGPPGSRAIEKIFTDYFTSQGLSTDPTAFDGRSDYGPFIAEGIPAGGLFSGAEEIKTEEQAAEFGGTAGVALDACYHLACDDITNLSTNALYELGDAAAHATLVLAKTKTGFFPDGSRVRAGTDRAQARTATKTPMVTTGPQARG